jgi:hypothetical protein
MIFVLLFCDYICHSFVKFFKYGSPVYFQPKIEFRNLGRYKLTKRKNPEIVLFRIALVVTIYFSKKVVVLLV